MPVGVSSPLPDTPALPLGREVMDSDGGMDPEGLGVPPPPTGLGDGPEDMVGPEEGEEVMERVGMAGVEVGVEDPERDACSSSPPPDGVQRGEAVGVPVAFTGVGVDEDDRVMEDEEEGVGVLLPPPPVPVGRALLGEGVVDGQGVSVADPVAGVVREGEGVELPVAHPLGVVQGEGEREGVWEGLPLPLLPAPLSVEVVVGDPLRVGLRV